MFHDVGYILLKYFSYYIQSMLSSEDEDRDSLESVEGLLKKHENFEKSLAAQEEKFKVFYEEHN